MSYYGSDGFEKKSEYLAKGAVSVVIKNKPPNISANDVMYGLKERLPVNMMNPNSIIECRQHNRIGNKGSEYYVEPSADRYRRLLLQLNGAEITCRGAKVPVIVQPWERDLQTSNQHPQHSAPRVDGDYRSLERRAAKTSTSEPWTPPSPPGAMKRQSSGSVSPSKSTSQVSRCTLFLTKNPPRLTPLAFRDYFNDHLKDIKLAGVFDDDAGDIPPIQQCYESTTTNTYDGWVLETRTEKIADSIINFVSGKLIKDGTRLFFQRSSDHSSPGGTKSMPSTHRVRNSKIYGEDDNNNFHKFMNKKNNPSKVFVSRLPTTRPLQKFCIFVNTSMRRAKIFDEDIVQEAFMMNNVCVLLCPSPYLAQRVVDELDYKYLDDVRLTVRRHKDYQKAGRAIGDKINKAVPGESVRRVSVSTIDGKTSKVVPSSTVRQVSVPSDTSPKAIPITSPNTSSEESVSDTADTSKSNLEAESAKIKAENENLTKQIMKLLKENKDLKKDKENLEKEVAASKEKEAVDSETNKRKFDEMKRKHEEATSELENLNVKKLKVDEELVAAKGITAELKKQLVNRSKKGEIDDYKERLFKIHESWQEQSVQIQEQGEEIERLKAEKAKEAKEKEELQARLTEKEQKYQDMTDALVNLSAVVNEEKATRKELQQTLVVFRKAKKKAEKKLKAYQQSQGISEEQRWIRKPEPSNPKTNTSFEIDYSQYDLMIESH